MMRRFDASDDHTKELRNDQRVLGRKPIQLPISIKQLELQLAQLSATVNTRQSGTLPSNTIQNSKNDGHCMEITTRGGKQTIDPPMSSGGEKVIRDDDTVVEVRDEQKIKR